MPALLIPILVLAAAVGSLTVAKDSHKAALANQPVASYEQVVGSVTR